MTDDTKPLALEAKAWTFEEARKLVKRFEKAPTPKGCCLFETGYGPSGLPHLGTFQEVARTTMVMHAFQKMSDIPVKLFCVSDDMDGMRKVPDNLPNKEMLQAHIHKPLTDVPDPFGDCHDSYGAHMNAKLCEFLDHYGFDYEFKSARALYEGSVYDEKLRLVAKRYDAVMKVMLPTLGAERQATYSPFLPISPKTGRVLYVPMKEVDGEAGTITFDDEDGEEVTLPVTGGTCKLQWKPDFGMRWAALGVDFEMYGKEHQSSGKLYSSICRILDGTPPEQYVYELFLDEKGQKISKSKGNGLTIDEWLRYAPAESLSYYVFQSPRKAKRLYFDVIPRAVDDYLTFLAKYQEQEAGERLENPVWHIHSANPPAPEVVSLTFGLLLNLASACNPEDKSVLWGFISRYIAEATPDKYPYIDTLAGYAVRYYHDFVKPAKSFRMPSERESKALEDLVRYLDSTEDVEAEALQKNIYSIGKDNGFDNLRDWFRALYETLLGQKQGPRMGSFIALYGKKETSLLINKVLKGEDLAA